MTYKGCGGKTPCI